jgi:hypothetical protein
MRATTRAAPRWLRGRARVGGASFGGAACSGQKIPAHFEAILLALDAGAQDIEAREGGISAGELDFQMHRALDQRDRWADARDPFVESAERQLRLDRQGGPGEIEIGAGRGGSAARAAE